MLVHVLFITIKLVFPSFLLNFSFLDCLILANTFLSPFVVSSVPMYKIKLPTNFILSKNIKKTLLVF